MTGSEPESSLPTRLQGLVQPAFFGALARLAGGLGKGWLGMTIGSGHEMSSPERFREPDLAEVPTVLDDDLDKEIQEGGRERP